MLFEMVKIVIMIVIVLRGAFQDFYNSLTAPRTVSNTHAQVARAQSCANHVLHIKRVSRATRRVSHDTTEEKAQLKLTEFKLR